MFSGQVFWRGLCFAKSWALGLPVLLGGSLFGLSVVFSFVLFVVSLLCCFFCGFVNERVVLFVL